MNLSQRKVSFRAAVGNFFASALTSTIFFYSAFSAAEDIELYVKDNVSSNSNRPQVLLIFDTSRSMVWNKLNVKPSFKPSNSYGSAGDGLIYYTKGEVDSVNMPVAGDINEKRAFNISLNGCKTAKDVLDKYGFYTGHVREYTFQGNSGKWTELPDTGLTSPLILDCEDDVLSDNDNNINFGDGYPADGLGSQAAPVTHTANLSSSNVRWTGKLVTLYSAKYLRWFHNNTLTKVNRTYFDIAKESVINLINSAPFVDFGLQVFNANDDFSGPTDGGRIVSGIKESTAASRANLKNVINNLSANSSTPLCETLYETSRYFAGDKVTYGLNQGSLSPARDTSIESGSPKKYTSPYNKCSDEITVILITDGEPTLDTGADYAVSQLPNIGSSFATTFDKHQWYHSNYSYLAALAGWMKNNDINSNIDGDQTAQTFTIGFGNYIGNVKPLLEKTAELGGGKYYDATNATELSNRLNNILSQISLGNSTLTSASVAANNFDRTQTLDSVYFAMFQPDKGPRWQGNLKKYKIINGIQQGANNVKAVNSDGSFDDNVQSYWSSTKDGNEVEKGGVAEMLRGQSQRTIYSDLGKDGALVDLTRANAIGADAFGSQTDLAAKLDVADDAATIDEYLSWARGIDVDDADEDTDITENRVDVFGDPLHSKPVVINYGHSVYILVGTNQGMLHMFKDDDTNNSVSEAWAFMPKDLFQIIKPLRENYSSVDKVYGIDGVITSHIVDTDGDGIVEPTDGDSVWVFFGLRRGGNRYYALNIGDPSVQGSKPELMWSIDPSSQAGKFSELGQSWSQPRVTYSKLNVTGTTAKPVVIFGGGYDTAKDGKGIGGAVGADGSGKAIYMVDAKSGKFLWSLAPSGTTSFSGTDSIPSSIAILDSDADGLTDRLYAGDTGGNVWRVDMPGSDASKFSVFKLASLGGDASNSVDRRFFNEPAIVRAFITETIDTGKVDNNNKPIIVKEEVPYDAILIGSGDRTNPLGTDTDDVFYMIKDKNIITETFPAGTPPTTPATIVDSELYDYTNNPFKGLTGAAFDTLAKDVSKHKGWKFSLEQSGEKSTARALVINNVAYFTTYTPPAGVSNSCNIESGSGWLYAVDLSLGIKKYNWQAEDVRNREDRIKYVNGQFLGAPTLVVTEVNDNDPKTDDTKAGIVVGLDVQDVDLMLKTSRTSLYIEEN